MPILKQTETPTGLSVGYHVAARCEADLNGEHQVLIVTVQSWPDESTYVANEGKGAAWNWYVPIPLSQATTIEQALTTAADSPFKDGSITPFTSGLEQARLRQWARIKQTRDVLSAQPIEVAGVSFDADERSRNLLVGALSAMQLASLPTIDWICADNIKRTFTLEQLTAVGLAMTARLDAMYGISAGLRLAIFDPAKTTVAEIEAIGWPVSG